MIQENQINITLFLILILFDGFTVYGDSIVWGELSKSVTLPCSFTPAEDEVIHWQLANNGKHVVHSFYNGHDMLQNQDSGYKDRTALFINQLNKGNASLQLRNLKRSDEQSYFCYVGTKKGKVELTVQLRLAAFEHPSIEYLLSNTKKQLKCSVENAYPTDAVTITWTQCNGPFTENLSSESIIEITDSADKCQCVIQHSILNIKWNGSWEINDVNSTENKIKFQCKLNETLDTNSFVSWTFNNYSFTTELASVVNRSLNYSTASYADRISVNTHDQSLELKDLKKQDSGEYMCIMRTANNMFINVTYLNITSVEERNTSRNHVILISIFVPVLLAACIIIFIFIIIHAVRKHNAKKGNAEKREEVPLQKTLHR
ncbi:HERV-H LTR-associating protein 2 isoform 2-T5 [Discoglossus pictus]